jgi:hypothetical protein
VLFILQLKNISSLVVSSPRGNIRVDRQGRWAHVRRRSRDSTRPAARPSAEDTDAAVAVHARTHYANAHVLNRALNVNSSATAREITGFAYSFYCCWLASPCIPTCHLAAHTEILNFILPGGARCWSAVLWPGPAERSAPRSAERAAT